MTTSPTSLLAKLALATATLAIGSWASAANAVGIVTETFGTWTGDLSTTEIEQWGSLPKFDTNLGILLSAKLTLSGHAIQSYSVTSPAPTPQTVIITSTTNLFFFVDDGGGNTATLVDPNDGLPAFELSSSSGFVIFWPGERKDFGPYTLWEEKDYLFPPNFPLSFFLKDGGDTFDVHCFSISGFFVTGGGGNIDAAQDTQAYCDAEIEYTYGMGMAPNDTPEPTMVLGLVSLAGAGIVFGRRKS
jgi:hypothetical protein